MKGRKIKEPHRSCPKLCHSHRYPIRSRWKKGSPLEISPFLSSTTGLAGPGNLACPLVLPVALGEDSETGDPAAETSPLAPSRTGDNVPKEPDFSSYNPLAPPSSPSPPPTLPISSPLPSESSTPPSRPPRCPLPSCRAGGGRASSCWGDMGPEAGRTRCM